MLKRVLGVFFPLDTDRSESSEFFFLISFFILLNPIQSDGLLLLLQPVSLHLLVFGEIPINRYVVVYCGNTELTENVCLKFNKIAQCTVCIFDDSGNRASVCFTSEWRHRRWMRACVCVCYVKRVVGNVFDTESFIGKEWR